MVTRGRETQDMGNTGLTLLPPPERWVPHRTPSNGEGGWVLWRPQGTRRQDRTGGLQGGARSGTHGELGSPWRIRELGRPWWIRGLGMPWLDRLRGRGPSPRPGLRGWSPTSPPKKNFLGENRGSIGHLGALRRRGLLGALWKLGHLGVLGRRRHSIAHSRGRHWRALWRRGHSQAHPRGRHWRALWRRGHSQAHPRGWHWRVLWRCWHSIALLRGWHWRALPRSGLWRALSRSGLGAGRAGTGLGEPRPAGLPYSLPAGLRGPRKVAGLREPRTAASISPQTVALSSLQMGSAVLLRCVGARERGDKEFFTNIYFNKTTSGNMDHKEAEHGMTINSGQETRGRAHYK